MLGLNYKLSQLHENNKTMLIAIVGAGQMGRGLVAQLMCIKAMKPAIVFSRNIENAKTALLNAGVDLQKIGVAKTTIEATSFLEQGKYVITDNSDITTNCDLIDCVVEATGVTDFGSKIAFDAIENEKHVVMLNVETDVCVGVLLHKLATEKGVIYTGSAGDEPGAVMELFDFADSLGFDVRVIGKGKNNKVDKACNPDTVFEEATRRGIAPKMLASFKDGTKTMVEMTAMSNATGFLPDVFGSHGAKGTVETLPKILSLKSEGGILNNYKVVEYVDGVAPGVFVIISTDKKDAIHQLNYLYMGEGPNYILYRPYHLCSLETPISIARACVYNEPSIIPRYGNVSETVAVAKRDLKPLDYLDEIGGFTTYGMFVSSVDCKKLDALPISLITEKTTVVSHIKKGEIIKYSDVKLDETSTILKLRKQQDSL